MVGAFRLNGELSSLEKVYYDEGFRCYVGTGVALGIQWQVSSRLQLGEQRF